MRFESFDCGESKICYRVESRLCPYNLRGDLKLYREFLSVFAVRKF